jgi:colanic acid/amylovoran/stewartan biosynthesis glycosyltransferase WcaL/AmsK/CpsK
MNARPTPGNADRPTAAMFCNTFLPYSQTFIWDELQAHDRYAVEVFAWRQINRALFPAEVRCARPWYPLTGRNTGFEHRFRRGGIDLVHAHFGWAAVPAAGYARRFGLPFVVTFHGYDVALLASGGRRPLHVLPYTMRAHRMLAQLDLGLCASAELLEMLVSLGVPRTRLAEHRLGIDLTRFRPGPKGAERLEVAMVGRLVEKKGFTDGLRAFAMFAQRSQVPGRLTVAGSGPLDAELQALATELGIATSTHFIGKITHAQVADLLAGSDVLLAPSRVAAHGDRDSGLLSAKEASACACVPVATRHGGIPAIVDDGVTGYLVDERDVDVMAQRLACLAGDDQLRQQMGRAAREKMAREYELRDSVRRLEEYYDEALRRHTPRQSESRGIVRSRPSSQ